MADGRWGMASIGKEGKKGRPAFHSDDTSIPGAVSPVSPANSHQPHVPSHRGRCRLWDGYTRFVLSAYMCERDVGQGGLFI